MAFKLESVVPWGRNMQEYRDMFVLTDKDIQKRIADFGGGPSSFNCEATQQSFSVTTYDIIYKFSKGQLKKELRKSD